MLFSKNFFWTIFHRLYIPVGIGNISCSEMSVCSCSLTITSYSKCCPLLRGPPRCPAQDLPVVGFCPSPPSWAWASQSQTSLGLWRESTCFVGNRYSQEIHANSTIFKFSFKNRAALAKNPLENKFQSKQASLSTFTKRDFGATRGLDLQFKLQGSIVIS
jgi:hypothetical protein